MSDTYYFLYDTETSGLYDKKAEFDDPAQPHCIQVGALLYNDTADEVVQRFSFILNHGEIEISEKALETHGITVEKSMACGLEPITVLPLIHNAVTRAGRCMGYNMSFDRGIMACAYAKTNGPVEALVSVPHFDLMKPMTSICKIPGKRGGYKWPKLEEAFKFVTGKELEGAHDALVDIEATLEVYRWCKVNNVLPREV